MKTKFDVGQYVKVTFEGEVVGIPVRVQRDLWIWEIHACFNNPTRYLVADICPVLGLEHPKNWWKDESDLDEVPALIAAMVSVVTPALASL